MAWHGMNYKNNIFKNKMLYKPFVSKAKNKKYSVYVKGPTGKIKLIHFGDKRYGQYHDKLGHYKNKDTNDLKKREAYYARHGGSKDRNTAKYWAGKVLW